MAEHSAVNRRVVGSSPTCGANFDKATSPVAFHSFVDPIAIPPLCSPKGTAVPFELACTRFDSDVS